VKEETALEGTNTNLNKGITSFIFLQEITPSVFTVTFHEHPVEASQMKGKSGYPAGTVDSVKYRKQILSKL
jgi:hypothetical protein